MPRVKKEKTEEEIEYKEKTLFQWKAAEQVAIMHMKKYSRAIVIIIALMGLWALYTSNFLFFVILILWGVITLVMADAKPRIHDFALTETGVVIDEITYPYIDIQRFWIKQTVRNKKKIFVMKFSNPMRQALHIPVPVEKSEEIRLCINDYVPQGQEEVGMSDFLEKLFP